jgi:KamA family protein
MKDNDEVSSNVDNALAYLTQHTEIATVILSGGDPLVLPTSTLRGIVDRIVNIDHVRMVRIGSKMLAFNPDRLLDDSLLSLFRDIRDRSRVIYLIAHFNHPREITATATTAIRRVQEAGVQILNQTPLIRGVNDSPQVLQALMKTLSFNGVAPYYVFQCRPTLGNFAYSIPIEEGYSIFLSAQQSCPGVSRQARFVLSHSTGKIQVVGMTNTHVIMSYHRAVKEDDENRIMVLPRKSDAKWLEDYLVRD